MNTIGVRLRELRQSEKLSQAKIAENRSAEECDVALEYSFGRTDKPQGELYEGKMKIEKVYPEMDKFIEMCFDPGSPINERLKETLREMLKEGQE